MYQEVKPKFFDDLFEAATTHCPFCIHSCVVSRDLVLEVQGWDESINNCEDWDLWARIARTGCDYVVASGAQAIYRTRPTSACFDGRAMLEDGITVLTRTHGSDLRVPNPAAKNRDGRDPRGLDECILNLTAWCAGQVIGVGKDATTLLRAVADRRAPLLDPRTVAHCLDVAGGIGSMGQPLHQRWNDHFKLYSAFLDGLEETSRCPSLASRTELELARRAADSASGSKRLDLGRIWSIVVDLHVELPRLEVPNEVDRVRVRVVGDGIFIGHVEVPVVDGVVEPSRLHDALLDQLAAEIFDHYIASNAEAWPTTVKLGRRANTPLASLIWEGAAKEPDTPPTRVNGSCQIDLAAATGDLRTQPGSNVDITTSLGGRLIRTFRVSTRNGHIRLSQIRSTAMHLARPDLIRAVVSVGIIGRPPIAPWALRERLLGASVEPTELAGPLRHVNVALSPPWMLRWTDSRPAATVGARRVADRLSPRHRRLAKSAYLHLQKMPRPGRGGRIPILMYHRVSPVGHIATDRWRVTPAQLDEHLAALQRLGCTAISVEQLRRLMFEGEAPPRRPVVLSFDDGYDDFAEHAWPRLRARGCGATVYVVAGEAGGTNRWDDDFEHPAPLMDWATLRRIAGEGVDIGSHSIDHPMMTSVAGDEALRQALMSKQTIEAHTGTVVRSFAYPYGSADAVVARAVQRAGYQIGVTCDHGAVTTRSEPMLLPRVEVTGSMKAVDLLASISRLRG